MIQERSKDVGVGVLVVDATQQTKKVWYALVQQTVRGTTLSERRASRRAGVPNRVAGREVAVSVPPPFPEIAKLAALTLMRLSEIRTLRPEHAHLEQGVVMLPRAKAGARPVILSGEAQKILRGQLEGHESEWVFPGPGGGPYERSNVGRVFRKAARGAGLRDFHFHDLRHHGATMALNKGFTAPMVMALGGWKTERMMRRYAAATDPTLRAAAEAVSGAEAALVGRLTPAPVKA